MNQQLYDAFVSRINNGYSYEQLEQEFTAAGYTPDQVRALYTEVQSLMAGSEAKQKSEPASAADGTTTLTFGSESDTEAETDTEEPASVGAARTGGTLLIMLSIAVILLIAGVAVYIFMFAEKPEFATNEVVLEEEAVATSTVQVEEEVPVAEPAVQAHFVLTPRNGLDDGIVERNEKFQFSISSEDAEAFIYRRPGESFRMPPGQYMRLRLVSFTSAADVYTLGESNPPDLSPTVMVVPYTKEEDICTVRDRGVEALLAEFGGAVSMDDMLTRMCAGDGAMRAELPNVPDGEYFLLAEIYDATDKLVSTGASPTFMLGDVVANTETIEEDPVVEEPVPGT